MKGKKLSVLLISIIFLMAACSSGGKGQAPPGAIPVMADTVIQKAVPVEIRVIGNVQAYSTVTVKSMVSGRNQPGSFYRRAGCEQRGTCSLPSILDPLRQPSNRPRRISSGIRRRPKTPR